MPTSPHKRSSQPSTTTINPFVEAFSRCRTSSSYLAQLLSSNNNASGTAEILSELKTLNSRVAALRSSAQSASHHDKSKVPGWQDELDAAGTLIWNRSTALKYTTSETGGPSELAWLKVVAELRRTACRLIRLGSIEPLTPDNFLSLLSLATKTSVAFLAAEQLSVAEELNKEAASYAAELDALATDIEPAFAKERAKALLAHYCCRIRTSSASGLPAIAGWVREKGLELIKKEKLSWREVEKLAQTAYDVGTASLRASRERPPSVEGKEDSDLVVGWLEFALQLLEGGEGESRQQMQLITLKALAQAYVVEQKWAKAEETLRQILDFEPSSDLRRRQIKFILARDGGDGEVIEAFLTAAKTIPPSAEETLRRSLRFDVLNVLCKMAVSSSGSPFGVDFVAQLFATAIFFLTAPTTQLPPSTAFLCITYIWRLGDKAYKEQRYSEAAEWYVLAAHQLFSSVDAAAFSKSIRKAALCLIDTRENGRAEQVLQLPSAGADFSKTHFVRFYNYSLLQNTVKASAAFQAMVSAPDFTPSLLLWAAKTANAGNNKDLLALVLSKLVGICKSGAGIAGVDLMVVIRCLIRLYLTRINEADDAETVELATALQSHLEAALTLATALSRSSPVPETLNKDLAWLYKSAFNVCTRFSDKWSTDTLVALYDLTASLIELDTRLSATTIDSDTLGKLWICKFAALSGKVEAARKSNEFSSYKDLAVDAEAFVRGLGTTLSAHPQIQVEKADALLDAAFAVKIEAQAAIGDWSGLVKLVENFEDSPRTLPVSLLKLVTDKATASSSCPPAELCSILRVTLTLLYARKDLEVSSMALWLRMMVSALMDREADEALKYVKNACQLISEHQGGYPAEEADWGVSLSASSSAARLAKHLLDRLLTTTWEYGVDAYSANAAEIGKKWCEVAIQVAHAKRDEGMGAKSRLSSYATTPLRLFSSCPLPSHPGYSLTSQPPKLRFAPSPTGYLHLGGLRTALYNHLLARKLGGRWVLRVEDTDRTRYVKGAVESLLSTLKWAKLDFDEGPGKDGGCSPYFQSERKEVYDRYLQELVDSGKAYHCFCSPDQLAATRKRLHKQGSNGGYDRRCLGLPKEDVEEKLNKGEKSISSSAGLTQEDLIYSPIQYDSLPLEDFVLRKSDGLPTYHFANVVDDYEMGVTHVLRGEEWLPSTPKHLQLYDALGLPRPQFAHLPLLINPDGSKLSKRAGDVRVEEYIAKGYEPEALLNFIALMGWSPQSSSAQPAASEASASSPPPAAQNEDVLTLPALISAFSLDGVNKNRATMQSAKLDFLNRAHIRLKLLEEEGRRDLAKRAKEILVEKWSELSEQAELISEGYLLRVAEALKDRIYTLRDICSLGPYFFHPPAFDSPIAAKLYKAVSPDIYRASITSARQVISSLPSSAFEAVPPGAEQTGEKVILDALNELVTQMHDGEAGRSASRDVMTPLRHALTGQKVGAGVPSTIAVLGRDEVLERIDAALEWSAAEETR
ncbi:hypothetical protein JCM11641_006792 [Rhodosporidiobolus odoratus]